MWSSIYYSHGLPEPPRAASPSGTHLANWNKERLQWPPKALTPVSWEPRSRHVCKLVQCPTCGQVPWETFASVSPRCPLSTIQLKIKHFGTNTSRTSLPYFGVKLSCVCLMFAYRNKLPIITLRWPNVTLRWPNVTLMWTTVALR